jgi:lipopolysaccharide/colanic/teichoic acid biosynthesis glycosyltransferase
MSQRITHDLMTSIELEYPTAFRGTRDRAAEAASLTTAPDERWRRVLNVAVASVGILLTAPLLILIALLVKFTSPGPILYTQTRIGIDRRFTYRGRKRDSRRRFDCGGQPFRILKFRTMHAGPVDHSDPSWASPSDPRVTGVGRWLRKLRLDELPQLINVLNGDMNIVGPRPEQPKIFAQLREVIPEYELRQAVRPGITGLAQINLPYDRSIDDVRAKVALDLEYIRRESSWQDFTIMLRTLPVILKIRGAW